MFEMPIKVGQKNGKTLNNVQICRRTWVFFKNQKIIL